MAFPAGGTREDASEASVCSLMASVSAAGVVAVLEDVLDVRAIPLNRKSSTHRRETGPDGPSHDGE